MQLKKAGERPACLSDSSKLIIGSIWFNVKWKDGVWIRDKHVLRDDYFDGDKGRVLIRARMLLKLLHLILVSLVQGAMI